MALEKSPSTAAFIANSLSIEACPGNAKHSVQKKIDVAMYRMRMVIVPV
jgi:hypothetical protein